MEDDHIEVKPEESVQLHGTLLSSYSVLCKSMIGSGIFAMAGACNHFGLIPGVLALCIAAGITWLSLHVLSILALEYRLENPSFYSVSENILPRAKWVLDVALIINCFGAAVAYVITSGTLMSFAICAMFNIAKDAAFGQTQIAMIVQAVMILALAPLCMMKEISSTKIANLIGLTCLLYIVIVTFVYAEPAAHTGDSSLMWPTSFLTAIGSFPTFIFAFACQQNVFTVANELKDASRKRLSIVCASSTLTGFLVYVPMMLIPFLTYGRGVEDNYLKNLDQVGAVDVPVIIAFVLASISVSISYVLQVHPVRRSVVSLVFGAKEMAPRKERSVRVGLVTLIMVLSYALAVGLGSNLSLPINLAGLLGGNTMCFVMPFLMYNRRYGWRSGLSRLLAVVLAFCLALYPLCLTGIIYEYTHS